MSNLQEFQKKSPDETWPEHWALLYYLLKPVKQGEFGSSRSGRRLIAERKERVEMVKTFVRGKMLDLIEEWLEAESKHSKS